MLFEKRPIPHWLAEEITEGYAQQMGFEKPEGAETMEGTEKTPAETSSATEEEGEGS